MNNYNIKSSFIRKRNNNYNVYIEYIDETGKLKQKSLGKYESKKDAEKHLIDLKSSINNNKFVIRKDITFVERFKQYHEDESKVFSPLTLYTREGILKNQIEPFFKDTKLKDVSPYLLQKFMNKMFSEYTSAKANSILASVKATLNEAYRLKEINENPCDFVKRPTKVNKCREPFEIYDKKEVKELVKALEGEQIELPILLMLTMGLRVGEAYGLRWQDIDFQNNTISINQILIYIKGGIIFKEPKTAGSVRTISAPAELMAKLKKRKEELDKYRIDGVIESEYEDLVCLNRNLHPYVNSVMNTNWKKFTERKNIRYIRPHDLRHTHATMLVLSGTDFKTISNRLGHTDIKITLNRYSHVLKEMDTKASENISKLMF